MAEANNINYKEQNVSLYGATKIGLKGGLFFRKENSLNNRPICIMENFDESGFSEIKSVALDILKMWHILYFTWYSICISVWNNVGNR